MSKCLLDCFWQVILLKMVTWKERQHDDDDDHVATDVASMADLQGCGLLKFFHTPSMVSHVRLLEYILKMWNRGQKYF